MISDEAFARDYHNQTTLHPVGLAAIVVLGLATLTVSRRRALVPMIITGCFISPAQRIVLAGADFSFLRLMILFGWARLFLRRESRPMQWKPIDIAFVLWQAVGTITYIMLRDGGQGSVMYRVGWIYECSGFYFLFRQQVRDFDDVNSVIAAFTAVAIPVAIFFLIEKTTRHNVFAMFGGVPDVTVLREGRLRCQGAFAHPILAGCFWASLVPLMVVRWRRPDAKRSIVVAGVASCLIIVVATASSTPIMALGFCMIGAVMYPIRQLLPALRVALMMVLGVLHLTMTRGVWYLISKVDIVSGSTGWHRSKLIDECVKHFADWWALGIENTAVWADYLVDVTNQYILEGVRGGVFTMLFYILIIVRAFSGIGQLLRQCQPRSFEIAMAWALGVSLFVHVMNFLSVSYFGQINMLWYLLLGMIGSLTPRRARPAAPAWA